jgi:hypothetical protein
MAVERLNPSNFNAGGLDAALLFQPGPGCWVTQRDPMDTWAVPTYPDFCCTAGQVLRVRRHVGSQGHRAQDYFRPVASLGAFVSAFGGRLCCREQQDSIITSDVHSARPSSTRHPDRLAVQPAS